MLLIQALPLYFKISPLATLVIVTSLISFIAGVLHACVVSFHTAALAVASKQTYSLSLVVSIHLDHTAYQELVSSVVVGAVVPAWLLLITVVAPPLISTKPSHELTSASSHPLSCVSVQLVISLAAWLCEAAAYVLAL